MSPADTSSPPEAPGEHGSPTPQKAGKKNSKSATPLPSTADRAEGSPPTSQLGRIADWMDNSPFLRILTAITVILGGVAAVVVVPAAFKGSSPPSPQAPVPTVAARSSSAQTPAPSGSSTPATTGTASQNGAACFITPTQPVDCDFIHSYEVISASADSCSSTQEFDFLGGSLGLDVTAARVSTDVIDGACVLVYPKPARGTAKDALLGDSAAMWRQCLDSSRGRDGVLVTCDESHDTEFTSTTDRGQATTPECEERAGTYMQKTWSSVSALLEVQFVRGDATDLAEPRCAISPRQADGKLGVALRRLGRRQVVIS